MDKLTQRILEEFSKAPLAYNGPDKVVDQEALARIAAKICLEVAEKSFKAGVVHGCDPDASESDEKVFEDFKQEIL